MREKIVLVEDDQFLTKMYKSKLEMEGYVVITCSNGAECLQILSREKPHLIITDLLMPVMNGFQLLQALKQNPEFSRIPVIVLSSRGLPQEIEKALSLGAKDYMVKTSITMKEMALKIKKVIEQSTSASPLYHYKIAIKETMLDAPKLASDFNMDKLFRCQKCGGAMILDLVRDITRERNWFVGQFICQNCGASHH